MKETNIVIIFTDKNEDALESLLSIELMSSSKYNVFKHGLFIIEGKDDQIQFNLFPNLNPENVVQKRIVPHTDVAVFFDSTELVRDVKELISNLKKEIKIVILSESKINADKINILTQIKENLQIDAIQYNNKFSLISHIRTILDLNLDYVVINPTFGD